MSGTEKNIYRNSWIYSFACVYLKHSYPPNMQILHKIEKNISCFEAHPLRTFNFNSYKADLFNKKQLKPSDFRVTKSHYTVFTIWFDSDLNSLHTESTDLKDKS